MAKSRNQIRFGLIGCGRVTETLHLPALQGLKDAEVVALADISPDRLERVARRFQIRGRYADYRRLLNDRSIDAVAVCVPAQLHVEVALAALEAGKHVFIEKPLALGLDASDRLIEQAKRSSSKVMVGFNMRWHRLVRRAREIIQQGTLGRLELLRTVLTSYHEAVPEWRKHRELGGGVLFEQAVHHFDLWRFLLQSEIEEVFAASRSGVWEDEAATVTARMVSGVLASSVFSERTTACNELEIYGQAGHLLVSCYRFDGLEYFSSHAPGGMQSRVKKMAHTLREFPVGLLGLRNGGDFVASYRAEWRHFMHAIRHDAPVECTVEDGRSALQVALAAVRSASSGHPVKIAEERNQSYLGEENKAALKWTKEQGN